MERLLLGVKPTLSALRPKVFSSSEIVQKEQTEPQGNHALMSAA